MGSPAVFSGSRTKLLSSKGLLLKDGTTIDNDGVRNYIKGGNAEGSSIGVAYSNTAGTSPVTGSGGSPTVSFARTTTNPLSGTASFLFTKPASNTQGQGWSWDFTIDPVDKAKVLQISFDYLIASGAFVTGNPTDRTSAGDSDLTVWIYDTVNSVIIQPSTYRLYSNSTTIADKFVANFQSASNSTSYRLIVHCGTTSTSAFTAQFDNVAVTTSAYVYGTPITDWQAYTPTISGFGTVSSVDFKSRKVGDSLEVQGKFTAGTVAASAAQVTLGYAGANANVTQDANKIASNSQVGTYGTNAAGTNWFGSGSVLATAGANYLSFSPSSSTVSVLLGAAGNIVTINGSFLTFFARVPITGWSSSVQMSDSADTRVVAMSGGSSGTITVSNTTSQIPLGVLYSDTHGSVSGNQITIPVSGYYEIFAKAVWGTSVVATNNHSFYIYRNGSSILQETVQGASLPANLQNYSSTIGSVYQLKAGDVITFWFSTNLTSDVLVGITNYKIQRVTGPSSIAATETVAASYYISANQSFTANTQINFDSKEFDSHGSVTTGAGAWKFTAPAPGLFSIDGNIDISGTGPGNLSIYKNGSIYKFAGFGAASGYSPIVGKIRLNAGDYIDIRPATSGGTAVGGALNSTSGVCNISITRIGL